MPTYFFNLWDGASLIEDTEGQKFVNAEAARQEAVMAAREMLAELVREGKEVDGQKIDILDVTRTIVLTVRLMDELRLKPSAKS